MIYRSQQGVSHIDSIQSPHGELVQDLDQIPSIFSNNFRDVYASKVDSAEEAFVQFLDQCPLPTLSTGDHRILNAPIMIEELSVVVAAMANSKSLGTDGLLAEIYKRYRECLLHIFVNTLNDAAQSDCLLPFYE